MKFQNLASLSLLCAARSWAFVVPGSSRQHVTTYMTSSSVSDPSWDDDVDYKQEFNLDANGELPDPTSNWNDQGENPSLGISIGKQVTLTGRQIATLKKEAAEMINDKIDEGIQDIERMRIQMKDDLDKSRELMKVQSELNAQREAAILMDKIDKLTGKFLDSNKQVRQSTVLAAMADAATEGTGKVLGSWGSLGGVDVRTSGKSLLGQEDEQASLAAPRKNRILIIADETKDPVAKNVIPVFSSLLQTSMDVTFQTLKPTETMPLGGDDAACVIFFATSLSSPPKALLERLLRRTLQAGQMPGSPPTQLVCVSTVGTERTNKSPYNMQNVLGGKLTTRRQIEESIISIVQGRAVEPSLDYIICKFGDIKESGDTFQFQPGDVLDGTTTVETAANVLVQAIAFQPAARNSTLCAVGSLPKDLTHEFWDEAFLKLDGPELWRVENLGDPSEYGQLVEYVREWSELLTTGKRLTTPTRAERTNPAPNPEFEGVKARAGAKLAFLPTNTGSTYRNKKEEREAESATKTSAPLKVRKGNTDGGIEVLIEVTTNDELRVRARRCNMGDKTTIKELSEEVILKELKDSIVVWKTKYRHQGKTK